jgi:hypothetical protein
MSEVNAIPVVTCPEGRWRGDWSDGYAVLIKELDATRVGIYRTVLDVYYDECYVTTLSVDLFSPRSREEFAVTMAARNGAHPVLWDGRLGHLYHRVEEARHAEDTWDPIQELPGLLPEVPAFAEDLLPKALHALALDIAERMQVPLDFIAIPLIVTAGAVIGRQCGIFPKRHDDWVVIPNLWGAVVGRPGLMKSPALTQALKPLERLAAQAIEAAEERAREQATTREILDAQLAGAKEGLKKAAKGGKADEIATHTAQIEELQAQVEALTVTVRRYKTNDATIQKLGELLRDNPTGMLLYRDELSGWLSSLRQDGREGDREFFLEAWNGDGGYTFDRIGRGMVHVEGLCLSILAGRLVLLLSPSLRQSQELFKKVQDAYRALGHPAPLLAESALRLEMAQGSRIISLPGTESTIRGYSGVSLLVIDEASRVPDELFYAVRPMLAVSGGTLVALSTPWGKRGWFYEAWEQGEGWERVMVTAEQCPRISKDFLDEERRTLPPLWFQSEYCCAFVDTIDQVFASAFVHAAISAEVPPLF